MTGIATGVALNAEIPNLPLDIGAIDQAHQQNSLAPPALRLEA